MRIFLGCILFFYIQIAFSQTVSIPDVNLRNKLLTSYPQVMQGDQLDLAKAAALIGTLDLSNSNITDATGIQYFTGINMLNLGFNQLKAIPDISGISSLVYFYASNNQLTILPDMSALTQLRDFQAMNNQLTVLPDLTGATELRLIYCSNNNISTLPPLTQFPKLTHLVIGDNPFANPIDFSSCINLLELHIHKIGTDTIIGLEKLKKLNILYAWKNNIRDISGLDSITTITLCVVYDNLLKNIFYLANKPNLNNLNVHGCRLTFEDIVPVIQSSPPAIFSYHSQLPFPFLDITARAENAFTLKYPSDNPNSGNRYVWLKNGVKIDSSASPTFKFNPLTFSDSGNYVLKVYNTFAPSLVLNSDTFNISVSPCIEFNLPSVSILSKECGKGYTIDLSNAPINGGTAPFTYELYNGFQTKIYQNEVIENISAGNYKITIIDSKNCRATSGFVLDRIEKCDPVLTPNGDGIADTYFFEKAGKVKIYDLKRKLVKTLNAPAVWDGSDQNGALLDAGYYIIIMEGETPVNISIIR